MNPYQQASFNLAPGHYFTTAWQASPEAHPLQNTRRCVLGIVLDDGLVALFVCDTSVHKIDDDDNITIEASIVCITHPKRSEVRTTVLYDRAECEEWVRSVGPEMADELYHVLRDGGSTHRSSAPADESMGYSDAESDRAERRR